MSVITDQIKSYRAGTIDLPALIAKLSRRTYPLPARMQGGPKNPFARALWFDEQPSYTDGTWDEVLRARNYGLLDDDEYNQINAAFEAAHSEKAVQDLDSNTRFRGRPSRN